MTTERDLFEGAETDAEDSGHHRTKRALIIGVLVASVVGAVVAGVLVFSDKGTDDPDADRCDYPVIFYTGPKEDLAQEDIDSGCYSWMDDLSPEELAGWNQDHLRGALAEEVG